MPAERPYAHRGNLGGRKSWFGTKRLQLTAAAEFSSTDPLDEIACVIKMDG
jgi:hypothetical protein